MVVVKAASVRLRDSNLVRVSWDAVHNERWNRMMTVALPWAWCMLLMAAPPICSGLLCHCRIQRLKCRRGEREREITAVRGA